MVFTRKKLTLDPSNQTVSRNSGRQLIITLMYFSSSGVIVNFTRLLCLFRIISD